MHTHTQMETLANTLYQHAELILRIESWLVIYQNLTVTISLSKCTVICACTHSWTLSQTCAYIDTHSHTCTHPHTHTHTHTHTQTQTQTQTQTHTQHTLMHAVHTCTHVHTHTCSHALTNKKNLMGHDFLQLLPVI